MLLEYSAIMVYRLVSLKLVLVVAFLQYLVSRNKDKTDLFAKHIEIFDLTDLTDRTNPGVILDPTDHDPSDPKMRNKWFFKTWFFIL